MSVEIPTELEPLLHSTSLALVSTIGPAGTMRFAATLTVDRVTSQSGH